MLGFFVQGSQRPIVSTPVLSEGTSREGMISDRDVWSKRSFPGATVSLGNQHLANLSQAPGNSRFVNPVITKKIKECKTWQQLASVIKQSKDDFNSVNAAAAITHLAQIRAIAASKPDMGAHMETREYYTLVEQTVHMASMHMPHFGPRQYANVMWALAKLGLPCCVELLSEMLPASTHHMPWSNPQQLTNR